MNADYKVIAKENLQELEKEVTKYLNKGYIVSGNLVIMHYEYHTGSKILYYQSIVKYKSSNK